MSDTARQFQINPTTNAAKATQVPALAIEQVRKVFRNDVMKGKQVVLDGVSMSFPDGQCTGLLGHNGAGKTTAIRLILGLIKPDSGHVRFFGRALDQKARRDIGYMPEINKLPGALTPDEILQHQAHLFDPPFAPTRETRRQLVDSALAHVGLTAHRKKRIGKLSKGMARRLAFAQATIHRPKLLILDEPSSGLDPLGRKQMLEWIAMEKKRGTTILLCTHELTQVAALCDGFHILRKGRVVASSQSPGKNADGAPIINQQWLLQASGIDEAKVAKLRDLEQLPPWQSLKMDGWTANLRFQAYEAASRWAQALLAKGTVVTRFGDEGFVAEEDFLQHFDGDR